MTENTPPKLSDESRNGRAERLMKKAEIFERHQRLGHLHRIDGDEIARQLRDFARQLHDEPS